jgi:23S rRNA (uracil1939-C5)-methyltransferase
MFRDAQPQRQKFDFVDLNFTLCSRCVSKKPIPNLFRKGDLLELKIEGVGSFGEGLAHREGAEIFTPKTMRDDVVKAQILESKKGRYRAELKSIVSPSPDRVPAPCRHFEICGGCDFQHMPYADQMEWKIRMTKHWIRRSSLAPHLDKIIFDEIDSPKAYGYRHRVRLQLKNGRLHYFKPHSNDLFEIEECPVLVEGFFEALEKRARALPDTRDWSQSFIDGKLVDEKASFELDGHQISFDERCFTQGNIFVNRELWHRVKEDVENCDSRRNALDLFCGVGNFSIPLTDYFEKVTGVESESHSMEWAKKNSSEVEWIVGHTDEIVARFENEQRFFDFVLLDPPRAGANQTVRILNRLMPPKITYVSCNLESLIQDLVLLVKHGGYKIMRWTVADMFPQTHHIESIVSLSR